MLVRRRRAGVVEVLTRYGERIGVAFQLSDDLLDVRPSEPPSRARRPGTDLREGVADAARAATCAGRRPGRGRRLRRAARRSDLADDAAHAEALALLRAHPAMAEAQAEVIRWADAARETLAPLPESPAKAALEALCDQVVGRAG